MSDITEVPKLLEVPKEKESWLFKIAGKKVSWALSKLIVAKISTPAFIGMWGLITNALKPIGITIIIDQNILAVALPGLIFTGLVMVHDFAKLKLGFKWL